MGRRTVNERAARRYYLSRIFCTTVVRQTSFSRIVDGLFNRNIQTTAPVILFCYYLICVRVFIFFYYYYLICVVKRKRSIIPFFTTVPCQYLLVITINHSSGLITPLICTKKCLNMSKQAYKNIQKSKNCRGGGATKM